MADARIIETLKRLPHGEDLPPELLERLAEGSRLVSYKARERILKEGDPLRMIYAVRSGSVLISRVDSKGRECVAYHVRDGFSFGEVALHEHFAASPFDASATERGAELVEVDGKLFLELLSTEEAFARALVGSLSVRVVQLADRLEELSATAATTRLARFLLRQPATREGDVDEIDLPIARKDLAVILAITPEHLSRLLRRWGDAGMVQARGRALAILQPHMLQVMADIADEDPRRADFRPT